MQLVEEKKEKFQKEMSRSQANLSEEQAQYLLDQHKQELEILERSMDNERNRQVNSLSEKIKERKRRKAAAMAQKHEAEMGKELLKQQAERQHVQEDKVREFSTQVPTKRKQIVLM